MKREIKLSSARDHIRPGRVTKQEQGRKSCFVACWRDASIEPLPEDVPSLLAKLGGVYVTTDKYSATVRDVRESGKRKNAKERKALKMRSLATGGDKRTADWYRLPIPDGKTLQDISHELEGSGFDGPYWDRGHVSLIATGGSTGEQQRRAERSVRNEKARIHALRVKSAENKPTLLPDSLMSRLFGQGWTWGAIPAITDPVEIPDSIRDKGIKKEQWFRLCEKWIGLENVYSHLESILADAYGTGIGVGKAADDCSCLDKWILSQVHGPDLKPHAFVALNGADEKPTLVCQDERSKEEVARDGREYAAMSSQWSKWQEIQTVNVDTFIDTVSICFFSVTVSTDTTPILPLSRRIKRATGAKRAYLVRRQTERTFKR